MQWAGWENRWNVRGGVTQQAIMWFRWKSQHGDIVAPEILPRWIQLIFGVKQPTPSVKASMLMRRRRLFHVPADIMSFNIISTTLDGLIDERKLLFDSEICNSSEKFQINFAKMKPHTTQRNKKRHFGKQILMGFCGSLYFLINVFQWGIWNCQPKDKQYGTEAVLLLSRRRFDYYSIRRRFWFDKHHALLFHWVRDNMARIRENCPFFVLRHLFSAAHSLFRQVIERLVAICEIVSIVILLRCGRRSLGLQSFLFAFGRLFLESIIYSFDLSEVLLHTRTALNLWSSGLVAEVIGLWRLTIEASSLNEFWI